ncbi:MAG: hypothetical protein JWL93_1934 [Hyphomicrobiales bacterium]|nr:hypothetical protein [Hyphomicrobiales bacterium]
MRYKRPMRTLETRLAGLGRVLQRCLFGLVPILICAPAALAQVDDSSPARYWTLEKQRAERMRQNDMPRIQQRPTYLIRRAAPVRGAVRPAVPVDGAEAPAEATPETPPQNLAVPSETGQQPPAAAATAPPGQPPAPAAPAAARAEMKAAIAVMGDNLGQLLGVGLTEAYANRPDVTVIRRAKENSGLVRDDYYDWIKAARELLDGPTRIDLGIILIGSNDRQHLRDGGTTLEARSPRWKEIYAARVKALATLFKDKNVPLIWVGLPIMGTERLSADMLDFNEIYKTAAPAAGAAYVDLWEAFADDRGQFSSYGPDINGQMVRLRAGDGVHFTKAGSRKLAHFVEGDIRRILEPTAAPPPADPAAMAAVGAAPVEPPPVTLPGTPPAQPATPATPMIAAAPQPPAPPPVLKPAAGPIVPLTAAPLSPGGRLATSTRRANALGDPDAAAVVEQGLVQGRPLAARRGRADDFAWPQN